LYDCRTLSHSVINSFYNLAAANDKKMKAIIIGTGRMAKGIASVLSKAYPNQVGIYSRDHNRAKATIDELKIAATVVPETGLFNSPVIIHTLWYKDVLEFVSLHKEQLKHKILVDITNPFNDNFDDFVIGYDTSSAEEIQRLVPETAVVGAFKNTYWVVFDTPEFGGIKSDVYVTSNDERARQEVIKLLQPTPFRIFDAGALKNNRTIERMTLLERELAMKAGNHPRVSFHLWGVEEQAKL
jgi:8-hydroxy-5-deazaflavin:NADPH oxidoreductase